MERKKILKFKSKVLNIENLTQNVKHLTLSIPNEFDFYPGQFISIILNFKDRIIKRPYSIASKPNKNFIDVCIKIVEGGLASPLIDSLKVDEEIELLGPMGDFIVKDHSKDIILISTGTGIGPFRSMIYNLLENNFKNKITLITGYKYEEDVLYENEFLEIEKKFQNFSYKRILSRSNKEENGYVQKLVEKNLNTQGHYYICGLKEMVNSVRELLEKLGIPKENVFFEKYD